MNTLTASRRSRNGHGPNFQLATIVSGQLRSTGGHGMTVSGSWNGLVVSRLVYVVGHCIVEQR